MQCFQLVNLRTKLSYALYFLHMLIKMVIARNEEFCDEGSVNISMTGEEKKNIPNFFYEVAITKMDKTRITFS